MTGVSKDPYKGVRDFYPEEQAIERHITDTMRRVAELHGFVEIDASILEPAELYEAKTSREIVDEQTYTFEDRGGRRVTLRPEMTPTVARMIAKKRRELPLPVKWFSIGRMYRYERPQRGRVREHVQLNADVFGARAIEADLDVLLLAADIMQAFGAKREDYEVRVNDRRLIRSVLRNCIALSDDDTTSAIRLLDRRDKIEKEQFETELKALAGARVDALIAVLDVSDPRELPKALPDCIKETEWIALLSDLIDRLKMNDVPAVFDSSLARGFDYYTGTVFEVFDTNPKNRRSLFGGGRYDGLMELFGEQEVPAVGFGMGDVTMQDFLETHGLLPPHGSKTRVALFPIESSHRAYASDVANKLRSKSVNVTVGFSGGRIGDQIAHAAKHGIPYFVAIGDKEVKSGTFTIKKLSTGIEDTMGLEELQAFIVQGK